MFKTKTAHNIIMSIIIIYRYLYIMWMRWIKNNRDQNSNHCFEVEVITICTGAI